MSCVYVWNWQAAPYLCWQICPWSKNSLLELAACLTTHQETISAAASELSPSETSLPIYCWRKTFWTAKEYLTRWFRSSSCPSSPAGQHVIHAPTPSIVSSVLGELTECSTPCPLKPWLGFILPNSGQLQGSCLQLSWSPHVSFTVVLALLGHSPSDLFSDDYFNVQWIIPQKLNYF